MDWPTKEMIEAGVAAGKKAMAVPVLWEDGMRAIYLAMEAARFTAQHVMVCKDFRASGSCDEPETLEAREAKARSTGDFSAFYHTVPFGPVVVPANWPNAGEWLPDNS